MKNALLRIVLCTMLSVALALPAEARAFLSPAVTVHEPEDAFGNLIYVATVDATTGKLTAQTPSSWLQTPDSNHYLYCSDQYDPDLGLYYLRARYMSADSGRFWSMDTYEGRTGVPATLNKYLFTNSNPVSAKDPSGNFTLNDVALTVWNIGVQVSLAVPRVLGVSPAVAYAIAATTLAGINLTMFAIDEEYRMMALSMPDGLGALQADVGIVSEAAEGLWGLAKSVRSASPFIRVAARMAGETSWGWFSKAMNKNGGTIWSSNGMITLDHYEGIAVNAKGDVKVLSGIHGDSSGGVSNSLALLDEDVERWAGHSNVTVIDVRGMSYPQIYNILNGDGDIICAWCWSENNPAVQTAIAAGLKD